MHITFLGTSAGVPTLGRNVTSQAVTFDHGGIWLLDCGEATQHQLMRAGLRPMKIERILITHLHGDHCFGLPGVLSTMAINGRTEPVRLIGPRGVRELIETTLRISDSFMPFSLDITELDPLSTGRELGTWDGWTVSSHPLPHRVPCFGYCLTEGVRPGRFHPDRAEALGVPAGRLFGELQRGRAVTLADGRAVQPNQVADPPRPGRKLVLLGDTSDPSALLEAGSDCDLLVCETTYDRAREDKARQWGHSTTRMTADFAHRLRARALIITHFSSRYTEGDASDAAQGDDEDGVAPTLSVDDLLAEAAEACPGTTVLAARDLWKYTISAKD